MSETPLPKVPVRYRPLGVRLAALLFGGLLILTVVVIGYSFSDETRARFKVSEVVTLGFILAGILAALYALGRSRIDATESGIVVVNGYRRRTLEWTQVVRLSLRPGAPWLVLDLDDGNAISAMGIQGSDGRRARRQFAELGALVEHYSTIPEQE